MKKNSELFCNLGVASGIIAIAFALYIMAIPPEYVTPSSMRFGADFYTEQYAATRAAALNIVAIGAILKNGIAGFLISFGIADICFFLFKKNTIEQSNRIIELLESMKPTEVKEAEEIESALKF